MEDFSTILTAVKPKDRTDHYKILAALFSLGGASNTVTTRQIQDVLKLNLPKADRPSNVAARLRDYSALVRIADNGPPLRWMIKEKGVERLGTLSRLTLAIESKLDDYDFDIGIICALEQAEFAGVTEAIGGAGICAR
jgi:hypothetical protein